MQKVLVSHRVPVKVLETVGVAVSAWRSVYVDAKAVVAVSREIQSFINL